MNMILAQRSRAIIAALAVTAGALTLAGCGAGNNNLLVAPGKYRLYDCIQLSQAATGYLARERVLREVMDKAERGPAGGLMSFVGYRTEYTQVTGNIDQLRLEVRAKGCNPPPPGLFGPAAPAVAPARR